MIIRNGEKIYTVPSESVTTLERYEGYKYGLSTASTPNIISDNNGEIVQVMMYISKTTYECLQGQSFSDATESSKKSVIMNLGPKLVEQLHNDPQSFWNSFIGGRA